ncbi:hypothetical protein CPLU01_15051 [Colletotrichum plurivorum]|uniref:Alcohol acetyltransferase FCK4 n=1 Tax=Colletotrichum plurivorum TaxID=2175906 RepID=A0A8H6JFK5_9PEZI|nr:hypothetical protein CPLU01_15051 [Colletotrichum plurivorum]
MKSQPTIVRPCGYMERYSTSRHSLDLYHCVSVTGRYAVPATRASDHEGLRALLQRAVLQVVLEQPMMRVGIVDEDKQSTSFVHIPRIDLSEHVQWFGPCQPDTVDATLSKHLSFHHSQPWPEIDRRPPWKVTVIPVHGGEPHSEIEVVYSFHHAINDGNSGSIFHSRLLEALKNPAEELPGLHGKELELPELPLVPPPQHELVNSRISWPFFLWTLWGAFGPSWLKSKPQVVPWKARPIDLSQPKQTNTHILRVPAPIAAKLVAAARAHSLTLTPLLHALTAASVSRQLPASEAPTFEPCSPVSLRRCVSSTSNLDTKNTMLVLVTSADHPIPSSLIAKLRESTDENDESAIWEVATCVKATLDQKLASIPHDDPGAMLKYVSDYHGFFRQKNGEQRSNSWELSNLGAIDGGDDAGDWRMTRAVFSQSASAVSPGFSVNVAGIKGGELTLTICWNPSAVDTALMNGVAADLEVCIPKVAGVCD